MASFHISPIGVLNHPWINKPDTKFNADGLFHTEHGVKGKPGEDLAAKIEQAAKAALAEHVQEMKPAEAKKWDLYLPFEREEDDDGNPTGTIMFSYKQNAKIKSAKEPSGFKDVTIEVRDSKDNVIDVAIWDGSEGRIMFSMRPIVMVSTRKVGVRLDFAKVQITKLVQGGGSSRGFGAVEDGYVADDSDKGFGSVPKGDASDNQGEDY